MDYNFELKLWYVEPSNFKERNARILIKLIEGSRMNENMAFKSFANMKFDEKDTQFRYANVTELQQFNRLKCNCLVYNLRNTVINNGLYDKCFIYNHSNSKEVTNYAFAFLNTTTGEVLTKHYIEPDYESLLRNLYQTFEGFKDIELLDYYYKRYNDLRNTGTCDGKDVYERLVNERNEKYSIPTYKKRITNQLYVKPQNQNV